MMNPHHWRKFMQAQRNVRIAQNRGSRRKWVRRCMKWAMEMAKQLPACYGLDPDEFWGRRMR